MSKAIGVELDGLVEWHIPGIAGYATLCGLDGDDSVAGQTGIIEAPRGTKINCAMCYQIWSGLKAQGIRETDFEVEP